MEWELSKENVQPLRRGRDVAALNAALSKRDAAAPGPEEQRKCVCVPRTLVRAASAPPNPLLPLSPPVCHYL